MKEEGRRKNVEGNTGPRSGKGQREELIFCRRGRTEIRALRVEELEKCIPIGEAFFAEGKLPGKFDGEVFCGNWRTYIESGIGAIFGLFMGEELAGVMGALIFPEPNSGEKQAMEMFWFVTPKARGRGLSLLPKYEEWARAEGAKQICMAHLHDLQPERLKQLYERRGYRPMETHYLKEI